jgi:hypothetical protein
MAATRSLRAGLLWLGAAVLVAAPVLVLVRIARRSVDRAWCERQMLLAEPLLSALERYREARGEYPTAPGDLVPAYLREIPRTEPDRDGNGGEPFRYTRPADGGFELAVTTLHWVSSFDGLFYRSSGTYPPDWAKGRTLIPMNGWMYVIGAQRIW